MGFQRHRITRRVINDLRKRSTSGVFFYMLVPYTVFFTDGYIKRHLDISLLFLGSFTAICLFRLLHTHISDKFEEKFESLNNQIFIVSVVLTALAWGIGSAYFLMQVGEIQAQMLMIICTTGFCSGGIVSFMPERRISILYNLLMLLPSVFILLMKGENIPLGIAMLFYSLYLILITLRGSDEYWNALENEYLLEEKTKELKRISRIDVLTGLYNRRHFDELFQMAWGLCARRETPITFMICDIDHFKKVNDSFGHLAGDEYLKLIGRCLQNVFQRETDVVARYGGEEFVIVLPDKDSDATRNLAERFVKNVADAVLDYNGAKIRTTISLGMACCIPKKSLSPDNLIFRADTALYNAKNAGRNRVLVYGDDKKEGFFVGV